MIQKYRRWIRAALVVYFVSNPWFAWMLLAQESVVAQAKADLIAAGENLSGPCGAFKITKLVAWRLRESGAGLLEKPSGNQCEFYAVDIIAYRNGSHVDILVDGGGANGPTWNRIPENVNPERWRAPQPAEPSVPTSGTNVPTPGTPTQSNLDQVAANLEHVGKKVELLAARQEELFKYQQDAFQHYSDYAVTQNTHQERRDRELLDALKRHDEEPSWARKNLRTLLEIGAGIAAAIAATR